MNRFAVFAPGFEHLSYPLGKGNAGDGHSFSDRGERFSLSRAQSEPHAQMALVSADCARNRARYSWCAAPQAGRAMGLSARSALHFRLR